MDSTKIIRASFFAAKKHKDQRRKDPASTPYINHPLEVANFLTMAYIDDVDVLCAAILHDTIEDTDTTYEELEFEFGTRVASYVKEVTDDKSLPKIERKKLQIEHSKTCSAGAGFIKLADKLSNLSSMLVSTPKSWSPEVVKGYAIWSFAVIRDIKTGRQNNIVLFALLFDVLERLGVDSLMSEEDLEAGLAAYYKALEGCE